MQRLIIITVLWVGFILQAVAVETLSSGVLAKGTQWETAFYQRDSGVDGPVVLVTGGIHGNEPAGARAAEAAAAGSPDPPQPARVRRSVLSKASVLR